jgi:hypothetical protein
LKWVCNSFVLYFLSRPELTSHCRMRGTGSNPL